MVIGLVVSFQDSNFSPSIYMEGYKYPPCMEMEEFRVVHPERK